MTTGLARGMTNVDRLVQELATKVLEAMRDGVYSLVEGSRAQAREVIRKDEEINLLTDRLTEQCVIVISLYQPNIDDARELSALQRVAGDLERIGDYAKGAARFAQKLHHPIKMKIRRKLKDVFLEMQERTSEMVALAVSAFLDRNVKKAEQIFEMDKAVNELEKKARDIFTNENFPIQEKLMIDHITHNLERMGDRAKNIARQAMYVKEGHYRHHTDEESELVV